MTQSTLDAEHERLWIAVRISAKYHDLRQGHFGWLSDSITFSSILLGLTSVYLFAINSELAICWKLAPGFIVATINAISLVFKFREKYQTHIELRRRFQNLDVWLTNLQINDGITADAITEGNVKRTEIEVNEPKTLRVLAVMCHNETVISMNKRERVHKITFRQKMFSRFFDCGSMEFPLVDQNK